MSKPQRCPACTFTVCQCEPEGPSVIAPGAGLVVVHAHEVEATRIRYLWEDRIPLSAVTIAPGEEGIGKSTVLSRICADITLGTLPGDLLGRPAPVVVVAPEDQLAGIAVPRLREAGADLTAVKFIAGRVALDGEAHGVEIPRDLGTVGAYVRHLGARLVWIDSLVTTMPEGAKSVSYKDVASILRRLGEFAEEYGVAVVAPWHLNKAAGSDTALRMMDSRAFRTAARSVLLMVGDPERPGDGLIALDKANGANVVEVPAIRYRLRSARYTLDEADEDTGEITQVEASCGVADLVGEDPGFGRDAARALLAPRMGRDDDPKAWLRTLLAARGETLSGDVLAEAAEAGHSRSAIYRAGNALGILTREAPLPGARGRPPTRRTMWRLPPVVPHGRPIVLHPDERNDRDDGRFAGQADYPPGEITTGTTTTTGGPESPLFRSSRSGVRGTNGAAGGTTVRRGSTEPSAAEGLDRELDELLAAGKDIA